MDITALLEQTRQKGVSDIHLASGNPPTIRVDGELQPLGGEPLSSEAIESMIYSIMTEEQRATYEAEKEIDFSFELSTAARFRVNAFTNSQGAAIVFQAAAKCVCGTGGAAGTRIVDVSLILLAREPIVVRQFIQISLLPRRRVQALEIH